LKILLCQLSDIHFKADKKNIIMERVRRITAVINSKIVNHDECFIVLSGDIAFSGNKDEYNIATEFVMELLEECNSENIHFLAVPGNHDCDFSKDDSIRKLIVGKIDEPFLDLSMLERCCSIQNEFFEFFAGIKDHTAEVFSNKLHTGHAYTVNGKTILFNLINTAWMSRKKEEAGRIVVPVDQFKEFDPTSYDVVVTMYHHPYGWFEPTNGHRFKQIIEKTSDIILTGHEHTWEKTSIAVRDSITTDYYHGGVLQDHEKFDQSDFNLVTIDLEDSIYRYENYSWKKDMYEPTIPESKWHPFRRNQFIANLSFKLSDTFSDFLNDPGTGLMHPNKENLILSDIFVCPELRIITNKDVQKDYKTISSDEVFDFIFKSNKILITADEKTGKTSLAKSIFKNFIMRELIPIIIDGRSFNDVRETKIQDVIKENFTKQYSEKLLERYQQLPKEKKCIIIDNFDKVRLNPKGMAALLTNLLSFYDHIILLADSSFRFQQLYDTKNLNNTFEIVNSVLLDFGHYLRRELINKWYRTGSEYHDIPEIEVKIIETERTVTLALGKNFLPSYPIFVLLILQSIEVGKSSERNLSSYGYLYQTLITTNLMKLTKQPDTLDMLYTFLSVIAFSMFNEKSYFLDDNDLTRITKFYNQEYSMNITDDIIKSLVEVGILAITSNKDHVFKYKYIFYYFAAKYLADNIDLPEIKDKLSDMCGKLHNQRNANIIIFICHLSKNPFIIEQLLTKSKEIFNDIAPYNFENHIEFILSMYEQIEVVRESIDDPEGNRRKMLKQKDEVARKDTNGNNYTEYDDNDDEDANQISEIILMNKAFKTIEILGQIVKNAPGSLLGHIKFDVISECYSLGMRSLNAFLTKLNDEVIDVVEYLTDHLISIDKMPNDEEKFKKKIQKIILTMTEYVCVAIIRKVSESLGNSRLSTSYKEVLECNPTTSFALLDLSVKLDCLGNFPRKETLELATKLETNLFSKSILIQLVYNHFYLYPCDPKVKQHICERLKIDYKQRTLLELETDHKRGLKKQTK